ncbi:hypothetical protein M426DRAFT_321541 [Hypoxylon sp. CI-4A]|nr:hypothetical protein M426DRAFT_321541 [Hypoxylon sp. CI-4A]
MESIESLGSLSLSDTNPSLVALPEDIFYIVFTYLDTAKSVASLAATCRSLYNFIRNTGWRVFVATRFESFSLSKVASQDEWRERARSLTSQSRDWDRRALVADILEPRTNNHPRRPRFSQSIPSSFIVDAHHRCHGNDPQDLIFWGAGEDVHGIIRHTKSAADEWFNSKGTSAGHRSGIDDVTAVSILKDSKYNYGRGDDPQVLVGRASGQLHLVSMGAKNFGTPILNCRGSNQSEGADGIASQTEIQALDVNYRQGTLAAATKQGILTYTLAESQRTVQNGVAKGGSAPKEPSYIWADDNIQLRDFERGQWNFDYIRSIKFVNEDTLAVSISRGFNPIQYLKYTPTGVQVSYPPRIGLHDHDNNYMRTVRAILPIDTRSLASGSGNTLLSSWDDGTIRLQDLRSPSPVDKVFQDNFEINAPVNALLSRGLERFVAGSASSPLLKVFDFRWPKNYYHTEALPCSGDIPYPLPRPPTLECPPWLPHHSLCDHVAGLKCRWHVLSRHDFYRPNFNMWLPANGASSVYTLASPSDDSPTIFAGLTGALAEITPQSSKRLSPATGNSTYIRHIGQLVPFIETGAGFELEDVARAQRMPEMHRPRSKVTKKYERALPEIKAWLKKCRFDS